MCILVGMQDASSQNQGHFVDSSSAESDRRRLVSLMPMLKRRADMVFAIRQFFREQGFLEVETPLRIPSPAPELNIDTEPSGDRFLIASPELQMKRLLSAGYERIFQICRCFRRNEVGRNHQPEFTMLEWYRAGGTIEDLANDCESLIRRAADAVGVQNGTVRSGRPVDWSLPFYRMEVSDAFSKFAAVMPGAAPDAERFNRDLVEKVEPSLPWDRPVFLMGYPASMASLAKIDPDNPARALRFELYACGLELANGFCELTDAAEQRRRFELEERERRALGKPPYSPDERFLSALSLGLPDCAGIAMGLDRLAMILLCADSIDEVVAFPAGTL